MYRATSKNVPLHPLTTVCFPSFIFLYASTFLVLSILSFQFRSAYILLNFWSRSPDICVDLFELIPSYSKFPLEIFVMDSYEDGCMYIILTPLDATRHRYHWGIYVSVSDTYGMLYHVTNSSGQWVFEEHMTENVISSRSIVAALQIGSGIQNDTADTAHRIMAAVPVISDGSHDSKWGEDFTCRVWVLEAVERLRQQRLVANEEAREVQDDAFRLARSATSTGQKKMGQSSGVRRQTHRG
ncbi:hypothetical protein LSUE1_G001440 [Lachnellula suecica]|uniref:Uncharacterized protein n=1 Tax=Lachnellula suecica TaxID=602035 RepID=A0A8T9CGE6_9HELO|nr:hypothetical protein LSUE1_G001440 [Lachnellula suecica]